MNDLKKKLKAANGQMKTSPLELLILMCAATVPMFILAHELDGDEFLKAISGIGFASAMAGIFAAFKLWKAK